MQWFDTTEFDLLTFISQNMRLFIDSLHFILCHQMVDNLPYNAELKNLATFRSLMPNLRSAIVGITTKSEKHRKTHVCYDGIGILHQDICMFHDKGHQIHCL